MLPDGNSSRLHDSDLEDDAAPQDSRSSSLHDREADRTLCYQCGGALVEWEPDDVPAPEHDHWFPECLLAVERKIGRIL
ncbi:hypothetical protein KUTeg_007783 [Tegillarca granosa]|uniref:Uncharacterized protein n=1 Tax=Tegillarca granosa TaxID=220873 RepID=A0ABQ9FE75_TEGGR|nr:hypothetical protein KUTeg_007783 [Tegillarca granosa]